MCLVGNDAIGIEAMGVADGVSNERFVTVLKVVVAPATTHRGEFGNDHRDVACRCSFAHGDRAV